jgi:arylsulfatase A-like enzyme
MAVISKWVRWGVQLIGVAAIAFGFLADFIRPGSSPGMGLQQWLVVLAGLGMLIGARMDRAGVAVASRRLRTWAADDAGALGPGRIALLAITLGLVTGLIEALVLGIDRFAFGAIVRVGPHVVWMAPLLDAAILTGIGMLLWLGSRFWRKLATPTLVTAVLLALSADAILHRTRLHPRISTEAKWLLVIGLTAVLAPRVVRGLAISPLRLRRSALAAATVVLVLGGAAALHPSWKERLAHAGLPDAGDRPNIILIILDTVRAASLSLYGYERPTTPQLEQFAAAGVVFDQAVSPSSWTLPSHGTMFTGQHLSKLEVDWVTPLDDRYPTVAERLTGAGYATAGFSANVGYVSAETGLARGFARFEDFVPTAGEAVRTSVMLRRILEPFGSEELVEDDDRGRRMASDINHAFIDWLDGRRNDRPFFAFLNYFDAHAPFYAAAPFDSAFGGPQSKHDLKPWGQNMSAEAVSEWIDAYDRSLAYIDDQLGRLFDELEQRGTLDQTIVIVSSDHGELLGEHSFMGHATTLYRPVLEVPLVVRGPGVPRGVRVPTRVGLSDLAVTLMDLAGVDPGPIPGRSLAIAWGGRLPDAPVYSELGRGSRIPMRYPNAEHDLWSIFETDLHYIVSSSGKEELYRITVDRAEEHNLVDDGPAELSRLRALIREYRSEGVESHDARASHNDPESDT